MLVLTRRPSESILVGESVVVKVMDVRGNQVRLGVEAPKDISVDREEVRKRKDQKPQQR